MHQNRQKNGTQKWRLQSIQSSKKGAWNLSANNSETVAHKDLRLGQIVYILVFYNVSFSLPVPLDGFQFIFLLRNCENDQLLQFMGNSKARNFFWLLFARGHAYRSWSWGKSGAPNGNFRENICSEDDLRSRIFGAFLVKFLACLPRLGFSNIYKMV